jgi:hypothetical protein
VAGRRSVGRRGRVHGRRWHPDPRRRRLGSYPAPPESRTEGSRTAKTRTAKCRTAASRTAACRLEYSQVEYSQVEDWRAAERGASRPPVSRGRLNPGRPGCPRRPPLPRCGARPPGPGGPGRPPPGRPRDPGRTGSRRPGRSPHGSRGPPGHRSATGVRPTVRAAQNSRALARVISAAGFAVARSSPSGRARKQTTSTATDEHTHTGYFNRNSTMQLMKHLLLSRPRFDHGTYSASRDHGRISPRTVTSVLFPAYRTRW